MRVVFPVRWPGQWFPSGLSKRREVMYYGRDAHKAFIQVCELSDDGRRRKDYPIQATSEVLEAFGRRLGRNDHVVLEATFHTWTIHSILRQHAGSVTVANPLQVR